MRSWRAFLQVLLQQRKAARRRRHLPTTSSPSISACPAGSLAIAVGDGREFCRPVEALAREQLDLAVVEPRLQAVAVEFDLVHPVAARRAPCRPAWPGTARRKRAGRPFGAPLRPSSSGDLLALRKGRAAEARARLPASFFGRRLGACGGLFLRFVRRARPFATAVPDLFRPRWRSRPWCGRLRPTAASPPGYPCALPCARRRPCCLISSQLSRFSPRRRCMRTRCQPPLQLSRRRAEIEMALGETLVRIVFRLPGAAVPDHDRAAAIFALAGWCLRICCSRSDGPRPARRAAFRPGTRLGPRVTAQLFITPSSSSRRS